jgi:hypothetical protein
MKSVLAAAVVLSTLIASAYAATESTAFTNSHLISYGSDFSAAKTISKNEISTSDLNFKSEGSVVTEISLADSGISEIYQGLYFSGSANGGFGGSSSLYSSVSGENVIEMSSAISGTAMTTISTSNDNTKVESTSAGAVMVNPGTNKYELTEEGGHETITNSGVVSLPLWMIDETPKEYTVSFESYPLEFEEPADFASEDVQLNYGTYYNLLSYYAYDFSRTVVVDEITSLSEMNYFKSGMELI